MRGVLPAELLESDNASEDANTNTASFSIDFALMVLGGIVGAPGLAPGEGFV